MCLFVSGKKRAVIITAANETKAAIRKGMAAVIPTVAADIAGPKINPNPNDAPIIPKPFALFSSVVVSEITAAATGRFPAVIPSKALAKNKNMALGANAIMRNESAVPRIEIISKGFLPYLSDILPIMGVERN